MRRRRFLLPVLWLVFACLGTRVEGADIRFDVFVGHDGIVPAMGWFPVACEVQNDGPQFTAVFEVASGDFSQSDTRRLLVELPTGTLKRFVIPFHASNPYVQGFNARLLDGRRKVRAESFNIRPRKQLQPGVPLPGALGGWVPALPDIKNQNRRQEFQPMVARLLPQLFPDNPIPLETLDMLYLNTERALDLKEPQVEALLAWLLGGGHLVVGIEQVTQLGGAPWLEEILPATLNGMSLRSGHEALEQWLQGDRGIDGLPLSFEKTPSVQPRRYGDAQKESAPPSAQRVNNPYAARPADAAFTGAAMELAQGAPRDGRVLVGSPSQPLVTIARRGRGQLTLLHFNPQNAPFITWANRDWFWAKVTEVPPQLLADENTQHYGYQSIDGVFGAMIDSRQIRKLPVGWLLLLLAAYLVVIGPLDRWWLKKINRQMLTWLTFPAYVAFFSVLIYFIGYKLRAGESEYNELHLVDVWPEGAGATLRGRTYCSIYSPANARYDLASDQPFAAFRTEFGMGDAGRHQIEQRGNNFFARVSVPVWTSQLFVSDWWRREGAPLSVTLQGEGTPATAEVANHLDVDIAVAKLAVQGWLYDLGAVPAGETRSFPLQGKPDAIEKNWTENAQYFQSAANNRRRAFGGEVRIDDVGEASMAASFPGVTRSQWFRSPPGLDLNPLLHRGDAVLLAWTPDHAPVDGLNQFEPRRSSRDTLWRVAVPSPGSPKNE